ncbi:hypothetical protein [Wenjunlia tyrosinilytica]|uniref:Uncharacterized protein n=1 Tax=Wenjunlia tyrosinilytica TaxID=1544741 RepID=A0A918E275_9ACTN|nr:hypothetical protein [Wenjunlia tyrosinilytica]GGO98659.1 hypothetical protein GCM10012280_63310 [Wenjunlia tyrosinilytica]
MRPLSSVERAAGKRRTWLVEEERKARESRGEQGAMEFWLRLTRSRIAKDIKAGRGDVYAGFTLVCRLFTAAMDKRAAGDRRLWDDLLTYAQQVVDHKPPRS